MYMWLMLLLLILSVLFGLSLWVLLFSLLLLVTDGLELAITTATQRRLALLRTRRRS